MLVTFAVAVDMRYSVKTKASLLYQSLNLNNFLFEVHECSLNCIRFELVLKIISVDNYVDTSSCLGSQTDL